MSRTFGYTSPARRSRRLLTNGYYRVHSTDSGSTEVLASEDDDTASVDTNVSRSSHASEQRNVSYHESPTHTFGHRRNHPSPAKTAKVFNVDPPGSASRRKHGVRYVTGSMSERVTRTEITRQAATSSVSATATTFRTTVEQGEHAIPHLYGLTSHEAGEGSRSARRKTEKNHLNKSTAQLRVKQDRGDSMERETFKLPPVARIPQSNRKQTMQVSSGISDTSDVSFEGSSATEGEAINRTNLLLLIVLMIYRAVSYLSHKASDHAWHVGRIVYQSTTRVLEMNTWFLTSGITLVPITQYGQHLRKGILFLIPLLLAAFLCYAFYPAEEPSGISSYFVKPAFFDSLFVVSPRPEERPEDKIAREAYGKYVEERYKELSSGIKDLELSMRQIEVRIADKHLVLLEKIGQLHEVDAKHADLVSATAEKTYTSTKTTVEKSFMNNLIELQRLFEEKLMHLQEQINELRANHSRVVNYLETQFSARAGEISRDVQQIQARMDQYKLTFNTLNEKIDDMNRDASNFKSSISKTVGNVTYLKEISDKQFTENFLVLLQKGGMPTNNNMPSRYQHLALVFMKWLESRGFVMKEDLAKFQAENNKNISEVSIKAKRDLEKKMRAWLENKQSKSSATIASLSQKYSRASGSDITEVVVKAWISEALDVYSADRIALPDYALESAGGYIVNTRCAETYQHKTALVSVLGIPIYYNINTPRAVIQPNVMPGDCWPFKGSEGYVVIGLSAAIQPKSFTLEHIPRALALHNNISSAPKDFSVYGLQESNDYEGHLLGVYRYAEEGHAIQNFPIDAFHEDDRAYNYVELRIASNWGHPEFTCLYRFRVHGDKV